MEVGANIWYQRHRSMDEPADISLRSIFDELQRIEARLGEKIEGRCGGLEPVFDEGPVFDAEPVFDAGPIFDEEPSAVTMMGHNATAWLSAALHRASSASTTDKELVLDPTLAAAVPSAMDIIEPSSINISMPANCLTKFPNLVVNGAMLVLVYTATAEVILDPGLAGVASMAIVAVPRNVNIDAPSTCSMKCLRLIVDITAPVVANAAAEEVVMIPGHAPTIWMPSYTSNTSIGVGSALNIFSSMIAPEDVVVLSMKCVQWQPWPPDVQLKIMCGGTEIRPMPWPSFCYYQCECSISEGCVFKNGQAPTDTSEVSLQLLVDIEFNFPWPTMFSPSTMSLMPFSSIALLQATRDDVFHDMTISCSSAIMNLCNSNLIHIQVFVRSCNEIMVKHKHNGVVQRPKPWPSFYCHKVNELTVFLLGLLGLWLQRHSVQFYWHEEALQYLKQRKCGGISELSWLKWIYLVLEFLADIAVGVLNEMSYYHGDNLEFSVGPTQASGSSSLKLGCLIMVSQLLTAEEITMCVQITERNMNMPCHHDDRGCLLLKLPVYQVAGHFVGFESSHENFDFRRLLVTYSKFLCMKQVQVLWDPGGIIRGSLEVSYRYARNMIVFIEQLWPSRVEIFPLKLVFVHISEYICLGSRFHSFSTEYCKTQWKQLKDSDKLAETGIASYTEEMSHLLYNYASSLSSTDT